MAKVQGLGKEKNDVVGISFHEKEPIKPSDMINPVDEEDDNELEWRDRVERADKKADDEILYHMRANSEEKKPYCGYGSGMTNDEFVAKNGGRFERVGTGCYRYIPEEKL